MFFLYLKAIFIYLFGFSHFCFAHVYLFDFQMNNNLIEMNTFIIFGVIVVAVAFLINIML